MTENNSFENELRFNEYIVNSSAGQYRGHAAIDDAERLQRKSLESFILDSDEIAPHEGYRFATG